MCGIVGYVTINSTIGPNAKRLFMTHAVALDTIRGEDSTGIFTACSQDKVLADKSILPGYQYIGTKKFNTHPFDLSWCGVGHNRAATVGKVELGNAHPFREGSVTMVHNGTLDDGGRSLESYDKSLEVDSQQICRALSLLPPERAHEVLENLQGSFALVWFDERDGSINFARNSERPLHFCWNSGNSAMWFMSDDMMLRSVNKSLRRTYLQGNQIYSMTTNQIYKFKRGRLNPMIRPYTPIVRESKIWPGGWDGWGFNSSRKKQTPRTQSSHSVNNRKLTVEGWAQDLLDYKEGKKDYRDIKILANNRTRSLPKPSYESLKEYFTDVHPYIPMEFIPDEAHKMSHGSWAVTGEVVIKEWGDTLWPAMIYGVTNLQKEAYWRTSWLVRPVSIGKPTGDDPNVPSMLCKLVHCDYEEFAEDFEEVQLEGHEEEDGLIQGPDGHMITRTRAKELLGRGCVSCGHTPIPFQDLHLSTLVNEGRDLKCPDCVVLENDEQYQKYLKDQKHLN